MRMQTHIHTISCVCVCKYVSVCVRVCVCVCAYRLGGRDYLRNETAMRKPFPLCLRLFARTKPNYFWHGFLYSDRGAKAGHSKSQLKTAKSGGCSQLNALFYALFVMQIVQTLAAGITKGLLKFLVRPLTMLLKLMVPAEIGAFMIGKMPKLLAKPIVR